MKLKETGLVFFDLDNTLTIKDTDELWARWRGLKSFRGFINALSLIRIMLSYRKGRLEGDRYIRFQRRRLEHLSPWQYSRMCGDFFEQHKSFLIPEMAELISAYKRRGSLTVIITAQNEDISKPFADELGADSLIANRIEHIRGGWGSAVRPYCFGEGKVSLAEEYARSSGFRLGQCAFYSDSIHDLPLLSAVGFPCVVNPDALLASEAVKRGWEVADFRRTHGY